MAKNESIAAEGGCVVTRNVFMPKQTSHSQAATSFIADDARTDWHDQALWHVRSKRDLAVQQVPEWEQLRSWASGIKEHTLSHLDRYLIQLEEKARHHGIQVHWASTAADHNRIVQEILEKAGAKHLVKSKSMLTEECGLNHHTRTTLWIMKAKIFPIFLLTKIAD